MYVCMCYVFTDLYIDVCVCVCMCVLRRQPLEVLCVRERERERERDRQRLHVVYVCYEKTTVGCVGALNQNFHLKLLINTLLLRGRIGVDTSLQFGCIFAVPVSFFFLSHRTS